MTLTVSLRQRKNIFMDFLDRVVTQIESYEPLGARVLDDGARLIGHVPHVAPEAWFHQIYAPISETQIRWIALIWDMRFRQSSRIF